jgi:hypothetical protein
MSSGRCRTDTPRESTRTRRAFLRAVGGAAGVVGLAGCGRVDRYEFRAKPVVLPPEKRRHLGYEEVRREDLRTEHTGSVGGVAVAATVETEVAVYDAAVPSADGDASIGVASTPVATVRDRSLNPLASRPLKALLSADAGRAFLARTGVDDLGGGGGSRHWERGPTDVGSSPGTCLEETTTLRSYAGLLSGSPPSLAVVHLTRVAAETAVIPALVHGRAVESPDRAFVGPDGYLARQRLDRVRDVLGTASAALVYATEPARESHDGSTIVSRTAGVSR